MFDLSVVMACHNRAYGLKTILDGYEQQRGDDRFEVIAVDDASVDDTYEFLKSYRPSRFLLRVERLEKNQGQAAARNLGVALTSAPLILFADDDVGPGPFLVSGHLTAHRYYPEKDLAILGHVVWAPDIPVNTLMYHIDGIGAEQFSYYYLKNEQEYDFRHFYTANVSIQKEFLLKGTIPGTDGKLFDLIFRYAYEDGELSYRLTKQGMRIKYLSLLMGHHYNYQTIWSFSTRQYRAGTNAVLLVRKHPELQGLIMGKRWPLHLLRWRLQSRLKPCPPDTAARLEDEYLHLASTHEWAPHPRLDQLYITLLSYFFYKGLIDGTIDDPESARPIHNVHAYRVLSNIKTWFTGS